MTDEEYLELFRETGALKEGHFILTSGRHSPTYFQCALVLQHPRYLQTMAEAIGEHFRTETIDVVISPAVGGIVLGTAVGQVLDTRTVFAERVKEKMALRRGFQIYPGERVLIVEDVITTGGSVQEVQVLVHQAGGEVVGVATIVDRSGGSVRLHPKQLALVSLEALSYAPDEIPPELARIPPQKPGSRKEL
jgi:orotate phosphoribosyltransferase